MMFNEKTLLKNVALKISREDAVVSWFSICDRSEYLFVISQ